MTTTVAQQRLLDAAVEAFAEQGYHGTTTRDIASRAQRSPAAVYIHHESKEDLLFAVSLRGHQEALAVLESAFGSTDDPTERLQRMVYEFSLWHLRNAQVGRVVQYELRALRGDHREAVINLRHRFEELMVQALRSGERSGAFAQLDVGAAGRALLSLGIDLVRWFEAAPGRDAEAVARANVDFAMRIVRP
ncbi:DNA-binding transcriptional regulator, AcrR family [Nakamurella panacisegetis]|uniref:DNA-binding transcriptional regulator, AcrR family n=1 Tax=Nakamurella panacisegetis TaxID=1090615 RepID=A0A1H0L8U0_9ACTN|nr:TetR family transcriptional regulator [Nakamurella panacisegetis]SDO64654.1 DNA-binding transcriptional regulator, AcrR family [Nakamurella panacisegetis]